MTSRLVLLFEVFGNSPSPGVRRVRRR